MAKQSERQVWVYADWQGLGGPQLMGVLAAMRSAGQGEVFSFEYDRAWLGQQQALYLDPHLNMYTGRQYLPDGKTNFGIFMDSSPDRWGRVLMRRREALLARMAGRDARPLTEIDFLLGVYDVHRMGAIRFKSAVDGGYQNDDAQYTTPPMTSLRALEHASLQLEQDGEDTEEELRWINMLIAPGSSLGGARPKASVTDPAGQLWIAKFPSMYDTRDTGAWEMVAHELAIRAGITVPESRVQVFSGRHHTFLTRRFDRTEQGERIHFASAMTLLGYSDGADHTTGASYLELAEIIIRYGAAPDRDLRELWRRIVFSICISNSDDHLRNHGFLLTPAGWHLSPAYDLNPIDTAHGLTLNISEDDNALDLGLARSVAPLFRLDEREAEEIIAQVTAAAREWQSIARQYGINTNEMKQMERAFSHF
ncbi:MAG: HipA domain-containing protein [Bacteroidetes bacterium]|nr:HipA domain-containing protein [Bacteroidota bacterium]